MVAAGLVRVYSATDRDRVTAAAGQLRQGRVIYELVPSDHDIKAWEIKVLPDDVAAARAILGGSGLNRRSIG